MLQEAGGKEQQALDIFGVFCVLLILAFCVWLAIIVPYQMAIARDRDGVAWVLVSLLGTPVTAILLLLALGTRQTDGPSRPPTH